MKVFIDSSFWVAQFNPNDSLHDQAKRVAVKLRDQKVDILISNLVFSEVTSVSSMRGGRPAGIVAGESLLLTERLEVAFVDSVLHQAAWRIFQEISQKDFGFVDCSILAVLRAEPVDALLTFDSLLAKLARKQRVKTWPIL